MSYQSPWDFLMSAQQQYGTPAPPSTYSTDLNPNDLFQEAVAFFQGGSAPVVPAAGPGPLQKTAKQSFLYPGVINLPVAPSADTPVLKFTVPSNWDGYITLIANAFNGPGFIPGDGSIIWRILQNGQAVKNYDNIQVALGIYSSQGGGVQPFPLADPGIPIFADDTIQMVVNNVSRVAAMSQIYGLLGGYFFPSGSGQ